MFVCLLEMSHCILCLCNNSLEVCLILLLSPENYTKGPNLENSFLEKLIFL